jgi:glycosyltransferase involved in cell wall biosynthesis
VLIAKDEEARLGPCLESLSFADEIVVVDSGSTDGTVALARARGARVEVLPWRGFGPTKRAAVDLARHDLVLNVDCDERVTPALAQELAALQAAPELLPAYALPRRTFLGDKEIRHCGWSPDYIVRLFDRRRAEFTEDLVHERVVARGEVGRCREALLHHSFRGFGDLIAKLDRYTTLSARQLHARGRRAGPLDLAFRPAFTFVRTYLLRLGLLDGVEGLEIAVADALTTFTKYAKLRELRRAPPPAP